MGIIVAIGGGEIGGFFNGKNQPVETTFIDKTILSFVKHLRPRVLFIPTASFDSKGYSERFINHYAGLGADCDILNLSDEKLTLRDIKRKIKWSEIIYVGGGNTLRMLQVWRKKSFDKLLISAFEDEKVFCGISAGAICWFKYGHSDSRRTSSNQGYIKVKGLNLVNALAVPHYTNELERKLSLKNMMKNSSNVAIALDNCSAIIIKNNSCKIISSKSSSFAYRVYWKKKKFYEEKIKKNITYSLEELFCK
jgi:dipeptidase E